MSRENLINPAERPEAPGFVRSLFEMIEQCLNGRTRNYGELTLDANQPSTTVENPLFESHQIPVFVPLTSNAAAEMGGANFYLSARANGQFTISHTNNAQTDRDFGYIFTG